MNVDPQKPRFTRAEKLAISFAFCGVFAVVLSIAGSLGYLKPLYESDEDRAFAALRANGWYADWERRGIGLLTYKSEIDERDLDCFRKLRSVWHIDFMRGLESAEAYQRLFAVEALQASLKELYLPAPAQEGIAALEQLRELRVLEMSGDSRPEDQTEVVDRDALNLAPLAGLPHLELLNIQYCRINEIPPTLRDRPGLKIVGP